MPLKRQYQIFVNEMIKHGDQVRAYKKAYPNTKKPDAIRQGCHRLSLNVTVQQAIKDAADKINALATQEAVIELKDQIKANVLDRQEKREILLKIARGEVEIPIKKPVWDIKEKKFVTITVMEVPDATARMRAIDLDNKMEGDYAPTKVEDVTPQTPSSIPLEDLPDEVLDMLLEKQQKKDV